MKPATDYRAGNAARYHAHWLLRDGDRIVGPVSLDLLERGIRAGKVPLTAEMALDGHDEWLPVSRVLPRVKPEVLALPAPEPMPEPEPPASEAPVASAPAGEELHLRARKTCVFWPAPAEPAVASADEPAAPAVEVVTHEASFVGEVVEGELVEEEWKRATVRKQPPPLPSSWRQRTVLCAPAEDAPMAPEAAAQDVEQEGPITERMGAPETDRMPHVGEPDAERARLAQMRAWQATTQQRPIVRPDASRTPSPVAVQSVSDSRAQHWADQPWAEQAEPAPDRPWHEQPWHRGSGQSHV